MGELGALVVVIADGAPPVAPPATEDVALPDWQPVTRRLASGHEAWCATFPSEALARDPEPTLAAASAVLARWARTGAAGFGFLTRHEPATTDPELTSLAAAVRSRGWMPLRDSGFDLWLVTDPRPAPVIGIWRECGSWGAVMSRWPADEPDVIVHLPPPGWQVVHNRLRDLEPLALPDTDDRWLWFTEDLLRLRSDATGETVDVGWSPGTDPEGRFVIRHADGAGRLLGPVLESTLTRDALLAVREIVAAATDD